MSAASRTARDEPMQPHCLTVADTCQVYGFGKTTLYELIATKKVDAVKLGARTLILAASVERYIASLPRLGGGAHAALSPRLDEVPPASGGDA